MSNEEKKIDKGAFESYNYRFPGHLGSHIKNNELKSPLWVGFLNFQNGLQTLQ